MGKLNADVNFIGVSGIQYLPLSQFPVYIKNASSLNNFFGIFR